MTEHRGRGTMTVDQRGRTGNFGPWTPELDQSKSPHVAKVARELDAAMQIALRLHSINRAAVEKRGPLPEVETRRAAVRQDQRALAKIAERVALVQKETLVYRTALQPYSYDLTKSAASSTDTFAARQELRAILRSLPDAKARMTALGESMEFRRAALEQPAQASGLSETDLAHIHRVEMETRYPDELRQIGEADAAISAVKATLATINHAVNNELAAVSAPVAEAAPAPTPTSFG